jgi:hypothetical protein
MILVLSALRTWKSNYHWSPTRWRLRRNGLDEIAQPWDENYGRDIVKWDIVK